MQQNFPSVPWRWGHTSALIVRVHSYTQRFLEIIVGLLGIFAMILLIPPLWLANLIWAPGPLFYCQTRVGLGGCHFTIIKFRSMIADAEEHGAVWSSANDPRVTRIGHFLRRTHLDELPQCWNILKGEMSFIGPRPERPQFVVQLTQQIDGYSKRHQVKPGLTGWAQVNYGYGNSVEDARIKLAYDLAYIECRSWALDLLILWRTCIVIWRGQ